MHKKIKEWLFIVLVIFCLPLTLATAAEVQQVETPGSVSFTGFYEPIGTPDPSPPENVVRPPISEVAKPGGSLPKTNDLTNSWLICLGILIISTVLLLWKRQNHQNIK